jgi:hypothetical protein
MAVFSICQDLKSTGWTLSLQKAKGLDLIKRIIKEMNGTLRQLHSRETPVKILGDNKKSTY